MLNRILKLPEKQSFFLLGSRQTGKSTLIKKFILNKNVWELNLLNQEIFLSYLKQPELFRKEAIQKLDTEKTQIIFIDEIQRLPGLLNEVQYLMFEYPKCQFILTGSSARKLKRGVANLLGGRALFFYLYPITKQEAENKFDLETSLIFGSLPPIFSQNTEEKEAFLKAYAHVYLKEEIQAEGIVRDLAGFNRFLEMAASQNGEKVNYSAIARDVMMNTRNIQTYYQILEDTLVAFPLFGWRKSIRKQLSGHPKYYFFDNGVVNALCNRLRTKPDTALRGKLFEQWIIIETYRYINYYFPEIKMFYWGTNNGMEVDLLLVKGQKIIGAFEIKSAKQISSPDLSGLRSFHNDNPTVPRYVISNVMNAYTLNDVNILPWEQYFKKLLAGELF